MKKYNMQNIISISIDGGLENSNRIYDFLESVNDNTDFENKINIIINKVDSLDISKHREYYDGIYIGKESLIDVNYGIEVIITKNEIILNTKFRFIEWLMYSIQIALLKTDNVLVHGAAVEKHNDVTIFPSWGGVGKTAILNDFVKKHEYNVIGDDLFVLNRKGEIIPFPKPMVLYPYHNELFPEVFEKSPSRIPKGATKLVSKLVPKVKKALTPFPKLMNYLRNHNPQVKWILPYEVFGLNKISKGGIVTKAFWLERVYGKDSFMQKNEFLESQIQGSTINEFDQRVVFCVNVIMGLGHLKYDDYIGRWHEILKEGLSNSIKGSIDVSNNVSINDIGDHIYSIVK